jgi:NAD(P)-dependent dehydrogenase (short-subunit alcohol dehydrogenase family)
MDENQDQRVTIVTGGSRGIGAAIALAAAASGHAVVVNYGTSAVAAQAVVAQIMATGGRAIAVQADVADEAAVIAMFDRATTELGPLTGLVINAGTAAGYGRLEDIDITATRRMLEVNVLGALLCAREGVRRMTVGGSIVNISSAAARIGGPNEWVDYASSKGAIDTLTAGLSKEVAGRGIRVNGVRPGLIDTDFNDHATPGRLDRILSGGGIPMGRAGTVDEIAAAVIWLLSDAASYVSGATIDVTGAR